MCAVFTAIALSFARLARREARCLPEDPALDCADRGLGGCALRSVSQQNFSHRHQTEDSIKPVLAGILGSESVSDFGSEPLRDLHLSPLSPSKQQFALASPVRLFLPAPPATRRRQTQVKTRFSWVSLHDHAAGRPQKLIEFALKGPNGDAEILVHKSGCDDVAPTHDRPPSNLLSAESPKENTCVASAPIAALAGSKEFMDIGHPQRANEVRLGRSARSKRIEGSTRRDVVGRDCDVVEGRPSTRSELWEFLEKALDA
jgi:hypothetical protein